MDPEVCTPFWVKVAVIVVVIPELPATLATGPFMVATVALDEVQFAWLVRSTVLPSLNVPVAANC